MQHSEWPKGVLNGRRIIPENVPLASKAATYPAIFRCALHTPLNRLFDYLPPDGLAPDRVMPGQRLWVPFGQRRLVAVVVEVATQTELAPNKLRKAESLIDETVLLDPAYLSLQRWIADYYHHPLGDVIFNFLPILLRRGREADIVQHDQAKRAWVLSPEGHGLPPDALKRAPKQTDVIERLREREVLFRSDLDALNIKPETVRQLEKKGLLARLDPDSLPSEMSQHLEPAREANAEQAEVLRATREGFDTHQCLLLHGITGSGKTEVYMQLIADRLEAGQQAMVLVPEIGLTPQMLSRFERRFGPQIESLHSQHSERERLNTWLRLSQGRARVLIGTRSAIMTPMPELGLIIVDEEHDSSYKQQDGLRYSARDLAIKRAQQLGITVVLGSATPSLESLANVDAGKYRLLTLEQRAGDAELPHIKVCSNSSHMSSDNDSLSAEIRVAMERHLNAGQQVMLFLNRRGFAPALLCRQCGWLANCPACDVRMTAHLHGKRLICHHCDTRSRWPNDCPQCSASPLQPVGAGTQRLEQEISKSFPDTPLVRIDRDSTQRKGALQALLAQASTGEPCILLGTQMLAKGHHFPALSLVAILDSDSALYSADFRGPERLAQTITQVAGRAGRGEAAGEVYVQTELPNHPMLLDMIRLPFAEFAAQLLAQRQLQQLPPYTRSAALLGEHRNLADLLDAMHALWQRARLNDPQLQSVGPLPAPMVRKANRFRAQILFYSASVRSLHRQLAAVRAQLDSSRLPHGMRLALDIDPIDTN